MATSALDQQRAHAAAGHAEPTGLWSWLTTVDHKRIGILYGSTAFLFFLIGGDSLVDLPGWRDPRRIAELATLVAVNRPGVVPPPCPPGLGPAARPVLHVTVPPIGIASSDLRRRLAEGRSVRYQVPRGVEAYIDAHRLYRTPR